MKNLIDYINESILSSTNSGMKGYIQKLLFSPNNANVLNKEWSKLGFDFDAGDGTGQWVYSPFERSYDYHVTILKPGKERRECILALTNTNDTNTLVIALSEEIGKRKLQKWAEKIASILDIRIEYDKNNIFLKFI